MRTFYILFIIAGIMLIYQIPYYDFEFPQKTPKYHFFIFNWDVKMTWRNYLWHFGNRIQLIGLLYIIFHWMHLKFKPYIWLFLSMQIFLLVEFVLLYNAASFVLAGYKIGLSHFFIIFNALILVHAKWKNHHKF